jgi:hypothetical protein
MREGPVCYAESDDGIDWVKPNLGQVLYRGSRNNNAIALPDVPTEGFEVLREDDDPDPQRRYKAVYEESGRSGFNFPTMRTATSPDGLHWTAGPSAPVYEKIEQSSFYKFNGLYFVNAQMWPRGEGGRSRGRQGHVAVSPDFVHWLQEIGESFALPEPAKPEDCGNDKPYDQVHLGVGAVSFGNVLIGLYGLWHSRPYPIPGDWFGQATTSGDFGLVVSNDGFHFREPVKGYVFLAETESPVTPVPGESYPTILQQAHGILNVGAETRIYHGRWRNARYINPRIAVNEALLEKYCRYDFWVEVALASLPLDRWGALGLFPDATEGTVWSEPVTLPESGCRVSLNAEGASSMRSEIADQRFNLLPQYSGEESGTVAASGGFDCPVSWSQGSLAALGGQTVRFRFHVKKAGDITPRLYAVYLT